jgi:hypothetical protein
MLLRPAVVLAALAVGIQSVTLPPRFDRVQPELFAAGGAFTNAWADAEGDGDLDLFVGFGGTPANRLYRHDAGTFVDVAASAGVADARATRAAAWGDFDADGDPDLLVGFTPGAGSVLRLYRNTRGQFTDVTGAAGLTIEAGAVRQPSWVDVDADGDLDLFVAFRDQPNALFRNSAGRFTDVAASVGLADARRSVGAVWFDADADGDLDLYVANMDGDANGLFRNDAGRFVDVAEASGAAWGGRAPRDPAQGTVRPCAADVNNDGRFDLILANYGQNGVLINRGGGRFEDVSASWSAGADGRHDTCITADVDHDGRLDVYINGTVTGGVSYRDYLLRNTGARFTNATPGNLLAMHASHGAQWADVDADGDLDLAIAGSRADATHALFRNLLPERAARRSLAVRVVDAAGRATRAGAVVRVTPAGGSGAAAMVRLVDSGSGYNAQNDMPVHFGLAAAGAVDVEVSWPAAGRTIVMTMRNVDPRRWQGRALVARVPAR